MVFLKLMINIFIRFINDKLSEDFYHRISSIILLFSGILSYNSILDLSTILDLSIISEIGIYSGLFNITSIFSILETFLLINIFFYFYGFFTEIIKWDKFNELSLNFAKEINSDNNGNNTDNRLFSSESTSGSDSPRGDDGGDGDEDGDRTPTQNYVPLPLEPRDRSDYSDSEWNNAPLRERVNATNVTREDFTAEEQAYIAGRAYYYLDATIDNPPQGLRPITEADVDIITHMDDTDFLRHVDNYKNAKTYRRKSDVDEENKIIDAEEDGDENDYDFGDEDDSGD
jgi:hypothetical protein